MIRSKNSFNKYPAIVSPGRLSSRNDGHCLPSFSKAGRVRHSMPSRRARTCFDGFTLIEAMISVVVLAILAAPLFISQGAVLQAVASYSMHVQRIFLAQNFLYEARNKGAGQQKYNLEKKNDDPLTRLKYEVAPIAKKSYLSTTEHMVVERLTIQWDENNQKKKDTMISYLYRPKIVEKTS